MVTVAIVAALASLLVNSWVLGPSGPVDVLACTLVPPELTTTLVPGASSSYSDDDTHCYWRADQPPDDQHEGILSIQVAQLGFHTVRIQRPATEAQNYFVSATKDALSGGAVDVAGLGDSAYATVTTDNEDHASHRARAAVTVLAGPAVLTVEYTASPSSATLVLSAAVEVARTSLRALEAPR